MKTWNRRTRRSKWMNRLTGNANDESSKPTTDEVMKPDSHAGTDTNAAIDSLPRSIKAMAKPEANE